MLFWHKHSIDKALADLANFTPFPDEWTVEDRVLFEQAFSFHGKSFHRIRQMVGAKVSHIISHDLCGNCSLTDAVIFCMNKLSGCVIYANCTICGR